MLQEAKALSNPALGRYLVLCTTGGALGRNDQQIIIALGHTDKSWRTTNTHFLELKAMVRRIASQVHKQAARLIRQKFIKKEPAWYQAVLENPPLPLPPKSPPPRTPYDLQRATGSSLHSESLKHTIAQNPRPLPIHYIEDELRRQFFKDHPFEAFRGKSLLEGAGIRPEHPISGEKWTRLRQRGRNPSPEDAIRYAVNLHEYHGMALTGAYSAAVAQFRSLRSEYHIASSIALLEAESYGVEFGPSQVDVVFAKEEKALDTWKKQDELDAGAIAARKKWRAIVENDGPAGSWSRGQEYVRLWKEGVRPTYSPVLTEPVITSAGLELPSEKDKAREVARRADFMTIVPEKR
ncbi:hypothetical protein NLI96_g10102 [Meripilus lineatus]|uniref:Small ribosomal subunit protein mS23 n=1 Tax=Meripilus lineatus TaxID=2056292 RepID=A0AAD5YEM1_9APHY|nr:hypothetical protein NLI96_g10102 [Physisporinus lineatus]